MTLCHANVLTAAAARVAAGGRKSEGAAGAGGMTSRGPRAKIRRPRASSPCVPVSVPPRATCAACLVQQGAAWWVHIGDSRVYHMRRGALVQRTRDHSHVELLLREGLITAEQAVNHPMRNFVECCLGGDPILPDMTLSGRRPLEPDDVVFVCTDGMWAALKDEEIASRLSTANAPVRDTLNSLGHVAVSRSGGASDNTSAAALRWLGD